MIPTAPNCRSSCSPLYCLRLRSTLPRLSMYLSIYPSYHFPSLFLCVFSVHLWFYLPFSLSIYQGHKPPNPFLTGMQARTRDSPNETSLLAVAGEGRQRLGCQDAAPSGPRADPKVPSISCGVLFWGCPCLEGQEAYDLIQIPPTSQLQSGTLYTQ